MKLINLKGVLASLLLALFVFYPSEKIKAQAIDSTTLIRKIDFRGKHPQSAVVASLSASRDKVVVLLVRGADENLITEAEGQLKALIQIGYDRIGMVISDNPTDEKEPAVSVFSNGRVYAVMEDAKSDTRTDWAIFNLVKDAYEEDVISKSNKAIYQGRNRED